MTTKILSTYATSGYTLASGYSELDILATGGVGGSSLFGVFSDHFATLSNAGTINVFGLGVHLGVGGVVINRAGGYISGQVGVLSNAPLAVTNYGKIRGRDVAISAYSGGSVVNGSYAWESATIAGPDIYIKGAPGTITNFGTISAFIKLHAGGTATNGGSGDTTALIYDGTGAYGGIQISGGSGTVTNFGTIRSPRSPGQAVNLLGGGRVTNGTVNDTAARIEGFTGVELLDTGTVTNFGFIDGTGVVAGAYGADIFGACVLTNGAETDHTAVIEGYTGVQINGNEAGTVANFGTIRGSGASGYQRGLYLRSGGLVTNGSADDIAALIEGGAGVYLRAAGTITNFGAIHGATAAGVQLEAGGSLTNGGGGDRSALVQGLVGVFVQGAQGSVNNFGTIRATGSGATGVDLLAGGVVVNGSLNNGKALIEGYAGLDLYGTTTATNFGTISGVGDFGGFGVFLNGGALTNGAAGHVRATIEGFYGVSTVGMADTVTNFGTIIGAGGTAVSFLGAADTLVVEAGCAFVGAVLGGGGTLDLDTGTGTLTGLLVGGSVTVSGSMAATTFQDFSVVEIGAAATFSTSGAVSLTAARSVIVAGSLTLGGTKAAVANAGTIETLGGTITVKGAVTGAGQAVINGGLLDFASSFNQKVTFAGTTGTLELAQSQTYTAAISGFSKTGGTLLDLDDIAFGGGTTATYSGTKTGGVLTVTDGTHTAHIALKGDYRTSTFIAASDGHGGTLVHDPAKASPVPSPHPLIAAMAGLTASAGSPVAWTPTGGHFHRPMLARP